MTKGISLIHKKFVVDGMGVDGETPVFMVVCSTMYESIEEANKAKEQIQSAFDDYYKKYYESTTKDRNGSP